MNGGTLNYNVVGSGIHKFYCGTTGYMTINVEGVIINTAVKCGSNALTCGVLTSTSGTLGGNTIATTNLIPSLTGDATLVSPTFTGTLTCGALTCISGTLNCCAIAITATLTGYLQRATILTTAYANAGRYIELGADST